MIKYQALNPRIVKNGVENGVGGSYIRKNGGWGPDFLIGVGGGVGPYLWELTLKVNRPMNSKIMDET